MRARSIKPGFFKNEDIAECSPFARLLFPGLWMLADREGKLEYRPKRIKAEVFPFDNVDVDALVSELVEHGLVKVYSVGVNTFLWVIKFSEHQRPHQNESVSTIPNYSSTDEALAPMDEALATKVTSTSLLIPSSLTPESMNTPLTPRGGVHLFRYSDSFEEFWKLYPNKTGKGAAYKAWKAVEKKHSGVKPPQIIAALKAQLEADRFRGRDGELYIPLPATWLNQARWDDEAKQSTGIAQGNSIEALLARRGEQ